MGFQAAAKDTGCLAIELTVRPGLLPTGPRRCLNISLYFVDLTGAYDPMTGAGAAVQRKTAVDVFTVAPGLEIDVGYATAVVGHPQLARGVYRTWRACADMLKPNATGFAAVRFRVYVVTGFNSTVSATRFSSTSSTREPLSLPSVNTTLVWPT